MVSQDRREKERVDVKNALEEYVYNLRDKLENDYKEFVVEAERSKMISSLNDLENWLYEEGSEEERSVYAQKLEELKVMSSRHSTSKRSCRVQ
jgi:heat shock protein